MDKTVYSDGFKLRKSGLWANKPRMADQCDLFGGDHSAGNDNAPLFTETGQSSRGLTLP